VHVAVLPVLTGAVAPSRHTPTAASAPQQQQMSAGAAVRQQLLERRLHRSKAMLAGRV
jgi:hypothetical protein